MPTLTSASVARPLPAAVPVLPITLTLNAPVTPSPIRPASAFQPTGGPIAAGLLPTHVQLPPIPLAAANVLPARPNLAGRLRGVEDGIDSALRGMPVIAQTASDVSAYQQQLVLFWNELEPLTAVPTRPGKRMTRQAWVAKKLEKQWQLSAQQQVTSTPGRDLVDQLFSTAALNPPGVFQVHGPVTTHGRQAEFSGVFVVTRSPDEGAFSSRQPVLLAVPGRGWIECTSGKDCKNQLQNIMNDPRNSDVLIRQIPAQDREVVADLENSLDQATQGLWFDATPINEPLFANRLQSMLTQQQQDISFCASENTRLGAPVGTGMAERADLQKLFPATRSLAVDRNPAAEAFSGLRARLLDAIPDVLSEARSYMRQQVKALTGKDINPDHVWLHTFDTAVSSHTAFSGYSHSGRPVRSQTLTDLALNNFTAEDHNAAPGALDQNNGFYQVDCNHIGQFDTTNELQLQPSTLMKSNWSTDFYRGYKAKLDTFWQAHQSDYRTILKGQFIAEARAQLRAGSDSWTADDFNSVIGATTQLTEQAVARGWGFEPPGTALTMADLYAETPAKGGVQRFDMYGYTSDILHIRHLDNQRPHERHVLYIPGAEPAFMGFKDIDAVREWLVAETSDPKKLSALASHFSLYDRQDGATIFGSYGVNSLLKRLYLNPFGWSRYANKHKESLAIKDDAFTSTVEHIKQRQYADANTLIKANGELKKDLWIANMSAAEGVFLPLAPLGAPLALASALGGATLAGLGINKAVNGDTHAERKQGAVLALQGALDILFSAGFAREEPLEDPFAAGMALEEAEAAPALSNAYEDYAAPASQNSRQLPAGMALEGAGSTPAIPGAYEGYAAAASRIAGLIPTARGIYRDSEGAYFIKTEGGTVFQIKSDFRATDNQVQLINPKSRFETGVFMETDEQGAWRRLDEVKGGGSKPGKLAVPGASLRGEPNTLGEDFEPYETPKADQAKIVEWSKQKKGLDPDFDPYEYTDIRPRFFARRQKLLDDANEFFNEPRTYQRAELPDIPAGARPESIIKPLYAKTDGMIIGESHSSIASKKFLIDNMRVLKEEGVSTLYMEHLQSDLHQADLNIYFKNGKMPADLHDFMVKQDFGHRTDPTGQYTFMNVLRAAQKENIRVVAIDSSTSYNLDGIYGEASREKMMSFFSSKVINSDQKVPHKWAALVGSAHVNEHEGIPGLAEMQHGIGIRVKDGPRTLPGKIEIDPGEQMAADFTGVRQTIAKADLLITLGTRNLPGR